MWRAPRHCNCKFFPSQLSPLLLFHDNESSLGGRESGERSCKKLTQPESGIYCFQHFNGKWIWVTSSVQTSVIQRRIELNEASYLHSTIDIINQIFANKKLEWISADEKKESTFNWFCLMSAGESSRSLNMSTIYCDLSTYHDGSLLVRMFAGLLYTIGWVRSQHDEIYATFVKSRRSPSSMIFSFAFKSSSSGKCARLKQQKSPRARRQEKTSNLFSLNRLIALKLSPMNEISRRVQTFKRVAKTISKLFWLRICWLKLRLLHVSSDEFKGAFFGFLVELD